MKPKLSHSLAFALLTVSLSAQPANRMVEGFLTTTRGSEYQPAISPDGRWLVYTSEGYGTASLRLLDLNGLNWRRDLVKSPSRPQPAEPLFPHPAATELAAFSPDGRYLAFMSRRDDALGDVYIARFPDGKPRRLSARGVRDTRPRFTPDGAFVEWTSITIDGTTTILRWSMKDETTTSVEAAEETKAPPPGDVAAWSQDRTLALVYTADTNGDGAQAPGDDPTAWELVGGNWRQVSVPIPDAWGITRNPVTNEIVVAGQIIEGTDIFVLQNSPLRTLTSAANLLAEADKLQTRWGADSELALACLAKAALEEGIEATSAERAEALLRYARALNRAGRHGQASQLLSTRLEGWEDEALRARLEAQFIRARQALAVRGRAENPFAFSPGENIEGRLRQLFQRFSTASLPNDAGEVLLTLAEFHLGTGEFLSAAEESEQVLNIDGISDDLRAQTILFRCGLFAQMGLESETRGALIQLLALNPPSDTVRNQAAAQLIKLTLNGAAARDESPIIALRALGSESTEMPWLAASLLVAEGKEFARATDRPSARKAWLRALPLAPEASLPALEAGQLLAADLRETGAGSEVLDGLRQLASDLESNYPGTGRAAAASDLFIDAWLETGRRQALMGDPALAHSTYRKLVEAAPTNLDAWRGLYDSASSDPVRLATELEEARLATKNDPKSALAWYRLALAKSYADPNPQRALKDVDWALSLDGTQPQFYLLRGFLQEQLYDAGKRRGKASVAFIDTASFAYEQGLSLVDRKRSPRLYGDFLLNSANTALALSQFFKANDLYRQRENLGVSLDPWQRELLFSWNSGIAAFQASDSGRAIRQFDRALSILKEHPSVPNPKAIEFELIGRRTLALMDLRRYDEAAAGFQRSLSLAPPDSIARVRVQRNLAFMLERQASLPSATDRLELLRRADEVAVQALAEVESPTLAADKDYAKSGGLIDINIAFSTDVVGGGAKLALDAADEKRLLHALRARIAQLSGDPAAARESWSKQLALEPKIDDTNRAYHLSLRAVTLSRLAGADILTDAPEAALDKLQQGLAATRYEVALQEIINSGAAVHLLAQLAEARLGYEVPLSRDAAAWWMIPAGELATISSDWELLDRAADRLQSLKDPVLLDGTPAVVEPTDLAKLHLIRALAREQIARVHDPLDPNIEVRRGVALHSASLFAEKVIGLHADCTDTALASRLGLLAWGVKLRVALARGDKSAFSDTLAQATEFAASTGQGHLAWWLKASAAIHGLDSETRLVAAQSTLESLLQSPVLVISDQDQQPWLLFDALEGLMLEDCRLKNEAARAWDVVDAWRVVRQRWASAEMTPPRAAGEEAEWLRRYTDSVETYRRVELDRQRTSSANPAQRDLLSARSQNARLMLDDVLEEGRRMGYATVDLLHPNPGGFDMLSALFEVEPRFALDRTIAGRRYIALYTAESQTFVDTLTPEQAPGVFFGSPSESAETLNALNTNNLFRSYMQISVAAAKEPVLVRTSKLPAPEILSTASALTIEDPLLASSGNPALWALESGRLTLGTILDAAPSAEAIDLRISWPVGLPPREQEARRLNLLAWLAGRGIVEATVDQRRWLGRTLDPRQDPDLAKAELSVLDYRLRYAVENGISGESIVAVRDRIFIKEALNLREQVLESGAVEKLWVDYQNLARLQFSAGRMAEAQTAAERALQLIEESPAEAAELPGALLLAADCAAGAEQMVRSVELYRRALQLQTAASDQAAVFATHLRMASALEAAGRFDDAISATRAAIESAPQAEAGGVLEARLRIARVMIRLQNRYPEGEAMLQTLLPDANAAARPDLAFEALVLRARAEQDTARFAESAATLDAASALGLGELAEIRVQMERGQNAWLLSDYFTAFRLQQSALNGLAKLDSTSLTPDDERLIDVLRISNRNLSGLISWAVNDIERAHTEIDQAIALSTSSGLDSELASSLNNRGLLLRSEAKYLDAVDAFEQALRIDERLGNRWGQAYCHRNIGITLTLAKQPGEALPHLHRAIELSSMIGDKVNQTKALVALGDALLDEGLVGDAAGSYNEALASARAIPLAEMEWRTLYGLGRLELQEGRKSEALSRFAEAVEVVDALRAAIRVEEFQNGFLLDKQDLYDSVVRLELDLGNVGAALESSERSRGRSFIDLLGNQRLNLGSITDQALLDREKSLRLEIEEAERVLQVAEPKDRAEQANRLSQLKQEYSDFLIVLRAENPQLAGFATVQPVRVEELQALLEPDTGMMIYHVMEDEVVCWVLRRDGLDVVRRPIPRKDLVARIETARLTIQNFAEINGELEALSNELLLPVLNRLDGMKRVCIVPHRETHLVPFAALPTGPDRYLIDELALFYMPSASVLRYTIERRDGRERNTKVLGLGNPDRQTAAFNLPFAEKEAERLRFDFPDVTIRTGAEATESWLVENLQQYGIIHIASHGEYDPHAPLFSALLLAADGQNDGTLSAQEIFSLQMRADLVALSACQTGLGRITSGDDIVGLNRAFVYAGTRQLLSTLWRVDDISTALLFKHFYRQSKRLDRAEALRQAQLIVRSRPEFQHPARWSGIALSGDWK